ncbi:hypothetical protein MalM25_36100 [Planctomycetes bacterium MalM25]|nr:hypothetical protein MalM25_36100 [Planctomycetes bacterium MalM25]
MRRSSTRASAILAGAALFIAAPVLAAPGDILFSSDLDTSTGLTVAGTSDTASTFGYDYSADGIPSAPSGSGTTGLKLEANLSAGSANEIAAFTDVAITADVYKVTVDAWGNTVGPFPAGGAGSTEFTGLAVGHDGVTAGRSGGTLLYTNEGGSSRDYRLYKNNSEQFYASGQYGPGLASNNASDPLFIAAFPGVSPPVAQGDPTFIQDGAGGFQWMTIEALVDSVAGTAQFTISSATSGNSVVIGTLDANVGNSLATTGSAAIVYADLFSSVSEDPTLTFGVFDNFVVTDLTPIPEPTSAVIVGLAALALLRRRRF